MNTQTEIRHEEASKETKALKRVIKWQGRAIALLALALIVAVSRPFINWQQITDTINNRQPIDTAPAIDIDSLEYIVMPYQGTQPLKHGDQTNQNKLIVVTHLYDYAEIKKSFPDLDFNINGLSMDLDQSGAGQLELTLKDGDNIIESSYRYQGKDHQRRQIIIKYVP